MEEAAIPVSLGGKFRDASGWGEPETGTNRPTPITPDHHYPVGRIWTEMGVPPPTQERDWIKPGKRLLVERRLEAGQRLGWQFTINGEMAFTVLRLPDSYVCPASPVSDPQLGRLSLKWFGDEGPCRGYAASGQRTTKMGAVCTVADPCEGPCGCNSLLALTRNPGSQKSSQGGTLMICPKFEI